MSRNIAPFGVRMPSELKEKVEESAKAAGRSMNAEIVHRLQDSYDREESGMQDPMEILSELKEKSGDDLLSSIMKLQARIEALVVMMKESKKAGHND